MKSLFIAGNWKSNKVTSEAEAWIHAFNATSENITIAICAPFTLLPGLKALVEASGKPLVLAAQNISPFGEGAYTGEITGKQIKEFADWVIVGHSERRKHFGETDEMLAQKVLQAKSAGLKVIYCVPNEHTAVPPGVEVVAYEPVWAIGTGKTDTPENANTVITAIKAKTQAAIVIYGGSVTADNVASFIAQPAIDGVLPGGASLNAEQFAALITKAR